MKPDPLGALLKKQIVKIFNASSKTQAHSDRPSFLSLPF